MCLGKGRGERIILIKDRRKRGRGNGWRGRRKKRAISKGEGWKRNLTRAKGNGGGRRG